VRSSAASALGQLGEAAAVEPLIVALRDENSYVRSSAASALGQLGEAAAVEPLISALSDADRSVCSSAARALGSLGATQALPILVGLVPEGDSLYVALVHLDTATALNVLERDAWRLRRGSLVERLRGYALWQMGDREATLASLTKALEKKQDNTNLLALAHFHLEQSDLDTALAYSRRALEEDPRDALALLSHAVILWLRDETAEALEQLRKARRIDRDIVRADDLRYDHFWGPQALATLEAMLAGA